MGQPRHDSVRTGGGRHNGCELLDILSRPRVSTCLVFLLMALALGQEERIVSRALRLRVGGYGSFRAGTTPEPEGLCGAGVLRGKHSQGKGQVVQRIPSDDEPQER